MANESKPEVAVVMGSSSDWETMKRACDILDQFGVAYHKQVISAHRTPELMAEFAHNARANGLKVIIAGAGGAAHLPGMIAAQTTLPVIGVPVRSHALSGWDSLLSIVQMPGGIPVATTAVGNSGATNAGLLAVQMLSAFEPELADKLEDYRNELKEKVAESNAQLVCRNGRPRLHADAGLDHRHHRRRPARPQDGSVRPLHGLPRRRA